MANHITNLQIDTYRGVKGLQIENLGRVNIFVGDNNTGKTSVLEAIQLLCNPSVYNLIQLARQREKFKVTIRMGLSLFDSILYMFDVRTSNKGENNYCISIGGTINGILGNVYVSGKVVNQLIDLKEIARIDPIIRHKLSDVVVQEQEETPVFIGDIKNSFNTNKQIGLFDESEYRIEINKYSRVMRNINEKPILDVKLVQTVDHLIENSFNNLIRNKELKGEAVELLKEFDDTITDIRYINDDTRFIPVIENGEKDYIPLSLYGDGMKKALSMLNAIVSAKNGVVLIDEFETALHTSAMNRVFTFILEVSKRLNVQLFLTTHSIEAVDKLLGSSGENIHDLRVIRLKKKGETTLAKVIEGKEALDDRKEYNMELRV